MHGFVNHVTEERRKVRSGEKIEDKKRVNYKGGGSAVPKNYKKETRKEKRVTEGFLMCFVLERVKRHELWASCKPQDAKHSCSL
jgi:hypothetical protein